MSPRYFELEVETSFSFFSLIFETPSLVAQNVVRKTAALASSKTVLEMQNHKSQPRLTVSESLF